MRVVSWIVVVASVGWLLANQLRPTFSLSLPEVSADQVSGTALANPHADSVNDLRNFAARYTAAWNSHDPDRVASFYARNGSIRINGGESYSGRSGLARMASQFFTAIPDLELTMTGLERSGDRMVFHWLFTGTHAETGKPVRIRGSETWRIGDGGLIEESAGAYDAAEYRRQIAYGHQP